VCDSGQSSAIRTCRRTRTRTIMAVFPKATPLAPMQTRNVVSSYLTTANRQILHLNVWGQIPASSRVRLRLQPQDIIGGIVLRRQLARDKNVHENKWRQEQRKNKQRYMEICLDPFLRSIALHNGPQLAVNLRSLSPCTISTRVTPLHHTGL